MNSNAPASDWLLYLVHFFDFAPFFWPRTGTGLLPPLLFPCRGDEKEVAEDDGDEEEDARALVTRSPAWVWSRSYSLSPCAAPS